MLKEPYSEQSYTQNSKYIGNRLALRPPQKESLERFARIADILSLDKNPDLAAELEKMHTLFPTLSSFERNFPSMCFSLATGIGKTRLMGAMIAYLVYEKGIKNFFVMAPNLPIYRKLKEDLGNSSSPKYVFKGLDKFVTTPRIIDGDNYQEFRQMKLGAGEITINVFNISKLNSESGRMHRLQEVLGQSYFEYLQSLQDLCIFMDESHHYHADRGFDTINELKPIIGVELTATPQIQKGSRKIDFKNVVYEYSLASALNDGLYVKIPTVVTRQYFHPKEYTPEQLDHVKLSDGIRTHEETKSHLEIYARTYKKPIVKPFVLVVARDTEHSKQIREYIVSDGFFGGYYSDKVLEIHSSQKGAEKEENIEKLLSVEQTDNLIEIVIHVNMLKEGWDVTNLYTIIPLRRSASETLTEQTIGRGLRLPYGQRTGVDEVDRLYIVSHDEYEKIIALANDPNSLVRKVFYINEHDSVEDLGQRETVELKTVYDTETMSESVTEQLVITLSETATPEFTAKNTKEQQIEIASTIQNITARVVAETNRMVKSFVAVSEPNVRAAIKAGVIAETKKQFVDLQLKEEDIKAAVEEAIEICSQILLQNVIPIPRGTVQPHVEAKRGFYDFTLDTHNMHWNPSDDTLIGTELDKDGETFTMDIDKTAFKQVDTVENEIVRYIVVHDNVDYSTCSELLYSLVFDAKKHFLAYLTEEETEKVMRDRQRSIAEIIYGQMNEHFYQEELSYKAAEMLPFTRIETSFGGKFKSDEICDLRATIAKSDVKHKIFSGFKKSGHTLNKFDSDSERKFAVVLESDKFVLRWLRPASRQFNIYWGAGNIKKYEPDFVVETENEIFMCEIKMRKDLDDRDVIEKGVAAKEYCRAASEFNAINGGKPWFYALIADDEITLQSSFGNLVKTGYSRAEQLKLEEC